MIEITDAATLRTRLDADESMVDVVVQNVDVDGAVDRLLVHPLDRSYFFGCTGRPGQLEQLMMAGALVFPRLQGLPFDTYRTELYRPDELFAGFVPSDPCSYCDTPDAAIYDYWSATGGPVADSMVHALVRRLHDHAITDALTAFLADDGRSRRAVAVMGGHDLARAADGPFAEIARLARTLTRDGFLLVSGGGPGAMEATHLGAWFASAPDERLDAALATLALAPRFDDFDFVTQAFAVVQENSDVVPAPSLGIPTWLYGHEPPTIFATHIAKYFDNSLREDGLVSVARRGIVFAPGGPGTVQEMFQDAAQNSYFALGEASPMVLLGIDFWTNAVPAVSLLRAIDPSSPWHDIVSVVDTGAEAAAVLQAQRPIGRPAEPWSFCKAHCQPAPVSG